MRILTSNERGGITPKTILAVAIVVGSIFAMSDYCGAYWQWYKARREALDIARFSRGMTDDQIKADLKKRLMSLQITKYSTVRLEREPVDQSHVHISFDYDRAIYVPPVQAEWKKVIRKKFEVSVEQGLPMVKGNM